MTSQAKPWDAMRAWIHEQGGQLMWESEVEGVGVVRCYRINSGIFHVTTYIENGELTGDYDVYTPSLNSVFDVQHDIAAACGL